MDKNKVEFSKAIALFRTTKVRNVDSKYVRSSDFSVMITIYNHPEKISAIEIGKYLGYSKVYASKVMKHLLEHDLIYREYNERDRRQKYLYLTEKGTKIVKECTRRFMESTDYLYEFIGEERAKELTELLNASAKVLGEFKK